MSHSRNRSFFKQYAKDSYSSLVNPEFLGMARKFYSKKQQHSKIHSIKNEIDKKVAFMQRMQKKMEHKLVKKEIELKYHKNVKSRFIDDLKRKQWLQQHRQNELKKVQAQAQMFRSETLNKINSARFSVIKTKRSMADLNRLENQRIRQVRSIKQAKQWDNNRSRVSQIETFKKNLKSSCNKFYQNNSSQSLKQYKKKMQKFEKFEQLDQQRIRLLESKLTHLKQSYESNKTAAELLNKQILKIRQQAKNETNLLKSRLKSHSSTGSKLSMRDVQQHQSYDM